MNPLSPTFLQNDPDFIMSDNNNDYNNYNDEDYSMQSWGCGCLYSCDELANLLQGNLKNTSRSRYNPDHTTIKISVHNAKDNSWSKQESISVPRDGTLADLKKILENKYHIPSNQQVLVRPESTSPRVIPNYENRKLKEVDISHEGIKLWLEQDFSEEEILKSPQDTYLPRAFAEINRINNAIEITFTQSSDGQEHKLATKCWRA